MQVPANGGVAFDSLKICVRAGRPVLQDLATIFLIRDNLGKRPIFFSWSDGGYPDQTLGLSPYLVSQGFVRKLMPKPVVANDSIVLSPSLGFLDLPRTEALLWDVYHWKAAARERPRGWVDPPSGSILQLYAVVYGGAARAFATAGQSALAARADSVAQGVTRNLTPGASSRYRAARCGRRSSPEAPPFQVAQVNGQPSPNGGSGCPGCPIRSCSISCRTTISSITQSPARKM